jgi:uncharacterized tellurite resistance protein B-like protein
VSQPVSSSLFAQVASAKNPLGLLPQESLPVRWVKGNESVVVDGAEVPTGLFYYGSDYGSRSPHENPGVIDPYLQTGIEAAKLSEAPSLEYLPEYRYLTDKQRFSYMGWLANGRSDPVCPEPYIILFVIGLERRILADCPVDATARKELPELIEELKRLQRLYRKFPVAQQIKALVEYATLADGFDLTTPPDELRPEQAAQTGAAEVFRHLKYRAHANLAVDAALGYALLRSASTFARNSIPATNESLFRKQFSRLFDKRYPEGFRLVLDNSLTEATYIPLCPALSSSVVSAVPALDATVLHERVQELLWLSALAASNLVPFVRAAARLAHPIHPLDLLLLDSLLPEEFISDDAKQITDLIKNLRAHVEKMPVEFSMTELAAWFASEEDLSPATLSLLSDVLEKHGVGLSPDLRLQAVDEGDCVLVFAGDRPAEPCLAHVPESDLWPILYIASNLTGEDEASSLEIARTQKFLQETLGGQKSKQRRLLSYLESNPEEVQEYSDAPTLRFMTKFSQLQRSAIAAFLFDFIHVSGAPSSFQINALGKAYPLLGLSPSRLGQDLSTLASGSSATFSFHQEMDQLEDAVFRTDKLNELSAHGGRVSDLEEYLDEKREARAIPPARAADSSSPLLAALAGRDMPEAEKPLDALFVERALSKLLMAAKAAPVEITTTGLLNWLGTREEPTPGLLALLTDILINTGLALNPDPRWERRLSSEYAIVVYFGEPPHYPTLYGLSETWLRTLSLALGSLNREAFPIASEIEIFSQFIRTETRLADGKLKLLLTYLKEDNSNLGFVRHVRSMGKLTSPQRGAIVRLLFDYAHAAGEPSPLQIRRLEKAYPFLGLAARELYRDLHVRATRARFEEYSFSQLPGDPITDASSTPKAERPEPVGSGANSVFNIAVTPPRQAPAVVTQARPTNNVEWERPSKPRTLDPARLAERRAETHEVQAMLAAEFGDNDLSRTTQSLAPAPIEEGVLGLDARHGNFVLALIKQESWTREDAAGLAATHGLRLDGALEIINEAAFNTWDEALLEGDDPIELNPDTVRRLNDGHSSN